MEVIGVMPFGRENSVTPITSIIPYFTVPNVVLVRASPLGAGPS